ncbi:MAG: hypothetical protein A2542_03180 [Parcubacteria group bacterium RIFOXYD2_FULL_52_8]|nr:MAG: hypothetical protein A2542_03180 [Parcubacteria group bacterium RIFOXYD2_FULL_52_8]
MDSRTYVVRWCGSVAFILVLSFALFLADVPYVDNDLIRQYQLQKVSLWQRGDLPVPHTVILGDSSPRFAMDAKVFSLATGYRTENLGLSGSFDLAGDVAMFDRMMRGPKQPKVVIFMHTLDLWARPWSPQGYFEAVRNPLSPGVAAAEIRRKVGFDSFLQYAANPREIVWFLSFLRAGPPTPAVDPVRDNFPQGEKTLANDGISLTQSELAYEINTDRLMLFSALDARCGQRQITCLYVHGPLHEAIVAASHLQISAINQALGERAKHIVVVPQVLSVPQKHMGNAFDHIAEHAKKKSTEQYAELLRKQAP